VSDRPGFARAEPVLANTAPVVARPEALFPHNQPVLACTEPVFAARTAPPFARTTPLFAHTAPQFARTAMVMAAGLGKRMRPLTITTPKPLVRVAGKPLIEHTMAHLVNAGMQRVIVNVHYLADSLEAHLKAQDYPFELMISDERDLLLETGGGLVKALPMIDEDPFFCLNSDNIWLESARSCFDELRSAWDDSRMDALLLLVPHSRATNHEGVGDFHLDQLGRIIRRRAARVAPYIYTGIQLLSRRLLVDPPEGAFSTNVVWNRAIAADRLFGIAHLGQWFDVGTPAAIEPTQAALLSA